jgi:bifunctional DNA-binding transcriptional regulator/antitoxin component of YhaV-PrlF toxin-antitoxin module
MRVAIDAVGRLVVPKPLRDELGIGGPAELDLIARDGILELSVADVPARVEDRDGTPVIALDTPGEQLSAEATRAAIDRIRR